MSSCQKSRTKNTLRVVPRDGATTGGYLVWVTKKQGSESHVHVCGVHETVESPIITAGTQIDSYVAPVDIFSDNGYAPFLPSTSISVDKHGDLKVLCLSAGITSFATDGWGVEQKNLDVKLSDRPTRIVSRNLNNTDNIGICVRLVNGNIAFLTAKEVANQSSSSSSFSSQSSLSSLSSSSPSSSSTSSSSSSSSSSSPSTHLLETSDSSTQTQTSVSSTSISSSSTSSSSSSSTSSSSTSLSSPSSSTPSSQSWLCEWTVIEIVDETFTDMDGRPGGVGTVKSEFSDINITGLNALNTESCNNLWCVYVPQGTYGVGGASVGQVYLYKSSSRPVGPPYSNSALVGGFPLDSSSLYGVGWPKTLPVSGRNGSGIGGSVKWSGGLGYSSLQQGCSTYRLQIPFKLRREESSSLSLSSISSSLSSQSICQSRTFWNPQGNYYFGTCTTVFDYDITESMAPNCNIAVTVVTTSKYDAFTQTTSYTATVYIGSFATSDSITWSIAFNQYQNSAPSGWIPLFGKGSWSGKSIVGQMYVTIPVSQSGYPASINFVLTPQ